MTVNANYADKPIDIAIFHGIKESGDVLVDQNLFTNGGEVCTGIQKLIQRWLLAFLTPKGSVHFHPLRGTEFISRVPYFKSTLDAEATFHLCNSDVCDQLAIEETKDMPLDEKLEKVILLGIELADTGFSLKVKVISKYGTAAPLTLPISVNPLQL